MPASPRLPNSNPKIFLFGLGILQVSHDHCLNPSKQTYYIHMFFLLVVSKLDKVCFLPPAESWSKFMDGFKHSLDHWILLMTLVKHSWSIVCIELKERTTRVPTGWTCDADDSEDSQIKPALNTMTKYNMWILSTVQKRACLLGMPSRLLQEYFLNSNIYIYNIIFIIYT